VIPILGARTVAQIEDDLGCLEFELTDAQADRLSEASPAQLGFPRAFLESDGVRGLIFGETFDLIDGRDR
jgi:diketogulonate reductase-like aldo/keto reductase